MGMCARDFAVRRDCTDKKPAGEQGHSCLRLRQVVKRRHTATSGMPLPVDIAFLAGFGVAGHLLAEAARISRDKGIAASEVLIARGWITRPAYGELLARHCGLGHAEAPPDGTVANFAPAERDVVGAEPLLIHTAKGSILCLAAGHGQAAKGRRNRCATGRRCERRFFWFLRRRCVIHVTWPTRRRNRNALH